MNDIVFMVVDFRSLHRKIILDLARTYVRQGQQVPKGAVLHKGARNGQWYESSRGKTQFMNPDNRTRTSSMHNAKQYGFDSFGHEEKLGNTLYTFEKVVDHTRHGFKTPDEYQTALGKLKDTIQYYKGYPEFGEMEESLTEEIQKHGPSTPTGKMFTDFLNHYNMNRQKRISRYPDYRTPDPKDVDVYRFHPHEYKSISDHGDRNAVAVRKNPKLRQI